MHYKKTTPSKHLKFAVSEQVPKKYNIVLLQKLLFDYSTHIAESKRA